MTTKVTITFEVPKDKYDEYEECLSDFDSNLQYIGIMDMDVRDDDDKKIVETDITNVKLIRKHSQMSYKYE